METLFSKQIHVVNGGDKITIEVDENTTFNSLMNQFNIENINCIYVYNTASNYKIIYPGYFHVKLKDYNIQNDYIIKFIFNRTLTNEVQNLNKTILKEVQIFIKNEFTNATRTLSFYPNTLIKDVKNVIFEYEGIPVDKQNLYYGNYKLENDRFLSDYNIGNDSTIRIKGRLLSCYVDDIPKMYHSR